MILPGLLYFSLIALAGMFIVQLVVTKKRFKRPMLVWPLGFLAAVNLGENFYYWIPRYIKGGYEFIGWWWPGILGWKCGYIIAWAWLILWLGRGSK